MKRGADAAHKGGIKSSSSSSTSGDGGDSSRIKRKCDRRRSGRGGDRRGRTGGVSLLNSLASDILLGKRVVFVTGAGISAASGVPTFRGSKDAVWSSFVYEWGTRERFEACPLEWYKKFWSTYFDDDVLKGYSPNPAHVALAEIFEKFNNLMCITQNVDCLHSHTSGRIEKERLIEIHGRAGTYKCFTEDCPYESEKQKIATLPKTIEVPKDLPACPSCASIMCPNCLLFDEDYESHSSYRFDDAIEWLEHADCIVFIGTSFAVGITSIALEKASERCPPAAVYNINPSNDVPVSKLPKAIAFNISEKAEVALPCLRDLILHHS